jgi:hypothetical protein
MSAIAELIEDTAGNIADLVDDTVGNLVDLVEDTVGNVFEVIGDVADWVMDDIINPIVEGIGDTIQYVLDNPIEAIAKIAAVASGQLWAIALVDAAIVLDNGGDFNDAVKAAAISYAGASIGATTGQYASAGVAKAGGSAIMASIVGAGTKSATTALVYGQDPLKAFATGGIQAAMGAALGKIDDLMEGSFESLQDGAKDTIFAQLAAKLEGGNITSDQMTGIISEYAGVGDFMTNFLKDNAGFSQAQAAVVTSAVMSSVSTALAGNPELSGEAFFAEFSKAGAEDLKRLIDKPVNKAIDKISGAYTDAEAKANLLNDATNNAATAAEKYNGVQATLATRIAEQDRLRGVYDVELANYNKNQSAATADSVNAASKAYNDYATKLETDYNETLKPQLDAHQADFNKWNTQIPDLEKSYTDSMAWVVTKAEDLDTELKPVMSAADKAVALTLSPTFDEAAYRKMNGLSATDDVYSHYLGQGQNLPTSKTAIDAVLGDAQYNSAIQALAAKGVDFWSLEQSQMDAVLAYSNKNLTSISAITGTDFSTFADKLIDVAKNTSTAAVTDYKKATNVKPADIAKGDAKLTNVNGELQWMLASEIASAFGGQVVGTKLAPAGSNPNVLRIEITQGNLQTNTVYTVPDWEVPGKSLSSMVTDARENNSFSSSLANTVMGLGEEAGRLFDTYVDIPIYDGVKKLYDYYVKDSTAEAALQNTASIVTGATGELLQAVSGLAVLAGINPADTLIGKAARSLLDVSGDLQTEDYAAGVKAINDQIGAAKGWRDTASAIYGAFADHPIQFLGEYVVKELIQEIPILLISGGTGNIAKKALLEAGEVFAKKAATRAAVSTGIALDMTEAFGGTAAGAFDEAYATATKTGMSEQDATDYALDVAQKAGAMATVMVLGTAGIGGQALSKSIFGDKVSDSTVEAVDTFFKRVKEGGKVTIKEGITEGIEEALPQLYIATNLAQIDPTYDVAGSVTASAILGKIAGAGTAGGIYTGHAVTDALMSVNSEVNSTINSATSATDLQQKLGALGVSDQLVVNNLLASKYGAEYTSSAEADAVFAKSNPSYTPTQEELDSFVGANKDADIQKLVDSHIDTRFIDIEEVKKAAAEEGITLTDEQAAAYAGQKDESAAVKTIKAEYDPQATTNEEAKTFFTDLGFTPTDEQVAQFVGAKTEEEQKAAIATFVDPLQTTEAEARKFFTDQGYEPTDEEVAARVGQIAESKTKEDIDTYVDPRQVTAAEVTDAYAELGLERPTDADIQALIGQYMETDLAGKAEKNLPTARYNSIINILDNFTGEVGVSEEMQEALNLVKKDMITALGDLGLEVAAIDKAVTEVKDAVDALPVGASPEDVSTAITTALEGLENISAEDVSTAITNALADMNNLSTDDVQGIIDTALEGLNNLSTDDVQGIIDTALAGLPETASPEDVSTAITTALEGLENISAEDVSTAITNALADMNNLSTDDVSGIVDDAIGELNNLSTDDVQGIIDTALAGLPETASPEDVSTAITTALEGLENISAEDVSTAITNALADMNNLSTDDVSGIVDDAIGAVEKTITDLETDLTKLIKDNDGDVDTALAELAADLGTTEEALLTELGTTKDALSKEFTEGLSAVGDILGTPGVADDPSTAADETQDATGLFATIAAYEAGGLSRDEALQKAIEDVSGALGTTKTDLLASIGETETSLLGAIGETETSLLGAIGETESRLTTEIGDSKTELLTLIGENEAAGMTRDEATQAAIGELAAAFDVGRTELLTAIGETEASLAGQLGDVAANLGADIQTVADLIGKPAREVTQTDIDFVIDLIAQENVSAELIAQYDVTGDGIVDINDQTMLETALQGGDVTLAATSMFDPATGLYLQQEQDTQALLDEQARIAEELRIQQELDTQTVLDQNTELNTQLNTQINTQSEALAKQAQDTEFRRMRDAGMFAGANRSATTPDPMNIDYLYNFESIFANPEQAGLFNSPYGAQRARPANQPTGPMPRASGFARGGQVEDENDMLLRILGDM